MNSLNAVNLSFSYGGCMILEKISFEVGGGEILTVLGPNGSGKTTLLKCLNQLVKPQGCVLINSISINISKVSEKELATLIGYVPQMHSPVRIPNQIDHRFRLKSSTDSRPNRPLIPNEIVHRLRANRPPPDSKGAGNQHPAIGLASLDREPVPD